MEWNNYQALVSLWTQRAPILRAEFLRLARASWGKACKAAGVVGVTFNDLRGTAVTRLALVGATEAEIATITGHSLRGVRAILDTHYLSRDPALGDSAITKLERGTKSPDWV